MASARCALRRASTQVAGLQPFFFFYGCLPRSPGSATCSQIPNYETSVVVAKNAGASKRAALIAKRLKLDFAMIFGEQTKFAECLSEETLLGLDGSLDG